METSQNRSERDKFVTDVTRFVPDVTRFWNVKITRLISKIKLNMVYYSIHHFHIFKANEACWPVLAMFCFVTSHVRNVMLRT